MKKDFYNGMSPALMIGPVVVSDDVSGTGVDLKGYLGALLELDVGINGDTFSGSVYVDAYVEESNDNSAWSACDIDDLLGVGDAYLTSGALTTAGLVLTLDEAHAAAANYKWGYVGDARYVRIRLDLTGTHSNGTPMTAKVLRGLAELSPIVA